MICPHEDSNSFKACIDCEACKPSHTQRVSDFLEMIYLQVPDYTTIAEGVTA